MKTFARFNALGKYTAVISCPDECLEFEDHTRIFIGEVDPATQYHDMLAGQPVDMPIRPSRQHIFDYETTRWFDPRTPETEWPTVRAERDRRLQASDWTQLPDVPLATRGAWAAYRQALRDITGQPDPFNIVWPVAP